MRFDCYRRQRRRRPWRRHRCGPRAFVRPAEAAPSSGEAARAVDAVAVAASISAPRRQRVSSGQVDAPEVCRAQQANMQIKFIVARANRKRTPKTRPKTRTATAHSARRAQTGCGATVTTGAATTTKPPFEASGRVSWGDSCRVRPNVGSDGHRSGREICALCDLCQSLIVVADRRSRCGRKLTPRKVFPTLCGRGNWIRSDASRGSGRVESS